MNDFAQNDAKQLDRDKQYKKSRTVEKRLS